MKWLRSIGINFLLSLLQSSMVKNEAVGVINTWVKQQTPKLPSDQQNLLISGTPVLYDQLLVWLKKLAS